MNRKTIFPSRFQEGHVLRVDVPVWKGKGQAVSQGRCRRTNYEIPTTWEHFWMNHMRCLKSVMQIRTTGFKKSILPPWKFANGLVWLDGTAIRISVMLHIPLQLKGGLALPEAGYTGSAIAWICEITLWNWAGYWSEKNWRPLFMNHPSLSAALELLKKTETYVCIFKSNKGSVLSMSRALSVLSMSVRVGLKRCATTIFP